MKFLTLCAAAALCAAGFAAPGAARAADVGVSVQISQPGVYGRIDIGRLPVPQVVLPNPVLITPPRPLPPPRVVVGVAPPPPPPPQQPIYMWVPPGHQKNWRKHCHRYNACGVPVYFVQDRWYDEHVRPGRGGGDHGRGHDRRDDHRDDHRDNNRGGRDHDGPGKGRDRRD